MTCSAARVVRAGIFTVVAGLACLIGGTAHAQAPAPQLRMGTIPPDKMTDEQKAAAASISPQGTVPGYLQPMLRSPGLVQPSKALADYLNRRNGALPAKLLQMPILIVSKQWMYNGSWNEHAGFAARDGMNPEIIAAIRDGRRPAQMAADEQALYDFCTELQQKMWVTDVTYDRAVAALGEKGVAETIAIMGYYTYLAMFNNTTRLPMGTTPTFTPATR